MIKVDIPGNAEISIENVVFDMNGTISEDGIIKDDVKNLLNELSKIVKIYVITSDTFGTAESQLKGINAELFILKGKNHTYEKREAIFKLGCSKTAVIGNGVNDSEMLKYGIIGIGILAGEGLALKTALNCDIIVSKPEDAINLLLNQKRLIATLRS